MDAAIFDIDGTLADVSSMRHYVLTDPRRKDFDRFHKAACLFAPAHVEIVSEAWMWKARGVHILVVTSRMRKWGSYTKVWMDKHGVPYDRIYMRNNGDHRRDFEVKKDILARIRSQGYSIVKAYDDNPNVLALWRAEGIPVHVVPGWDGE